MRYIASDQAFQAVGAADAVSLMEQLFLDQFDSLPATPRQVVDIPDTDGLSLFMPAVHPAGRRMGIKVSSIRPHNQGMPLINGAYLLLDYNTGLPRCVIDSNPITRLRTAATSALVTRTLLPDRQPQRLAILGAGVQAIAHAEALCAVLAVKSIKVLSRSPGKMQNFVQSIAGTTWAPAEISIAHGLADLFEGATILCTCTNTASTHALFAAADLPGSIRHINAIGGSTLSAIEIDPALYRNDSTIVESVEPACTDAGDVREAIARGALDPSRLTSIHTLLHQETVHFSCPTIYRSVGHAQADLALAELFWKRATRHE
jgi:ornithine cyclodeaminase